MALPGEKKRRWMDFAEKNDMNLTELIETSVDERLRKEREKELKNELLGFS